MFRPAHDKTGSGGGDSSVVDLYRPFVFQEEYFLLYENIKVKKQINYMQFEILYVDIYFIHVYKIYINYFIKQY